jgi:hypothetical protein
MGIQDRDWYREAVKAKENKGKVLDHMPRPLIVKKRKKRVTFWEFFIKSMAFLGAIMLIMKALTALKNTHF